MSSLYLPAGISVLFLKARKLNYFVLSKPQLFQLLQSTCVKKTGAELHT